MWSWYGNAYGYTIRNGNCLFMDRAKPVIGHRSEPNGYADSNSYLFVNGKQYRLQPEHSLYNDSHSKQSYCCANEQWRDMQCGYSDPDCKPSRRYYHLLMEWS